MSKLTKPAWFANAGQFAVCPVALLSDSRLNPRQVQVFLALAAHANSATGQCNVSLDRIAEIVGLSQPADVSRAISALVKAGWVEKRRRFNETNIYTVRISSSASDSARSVTDRRLADEDYRAVQVSRGVRVVDKSTLPQDSEVVEVIVAGEPVDMTYLELAVAWRDKMELGVSDIDTLEFQRHVPTLHKMGLLK